MGKIVGKICSQLYGIIEDTSSAQGIYTYELPFESKAAKIFLRKEYDFIDEELAFKELLVYLINTEDRTVYLNFLKQISPLEFDPAMIPEYMASISSNIARQALLDEVSTLYENFEERNEIKLRLEMIDAIDNSNYSWFDEDEEYDEEE